MNPEIWRHIFDAIKDPAFLHDTQFRLLLANAAYCREAGVTEEEALGKPYWEVFPPGIGPLPGCNDAIDRIGHGGSLDEVRVGEKFFLSRSYTARDEQDKFLCALHILSDITERKRVEEALRESEGRYRFLFENMLEGYAHCKMLFEHDTPLDFVYLDVNHAFESITGLKDVIGKRITELIPGIRESNPEFFEIYGRVALTGQPEKFEIYVAALGVWLSITAYGSSQDCFVAVFDNITERKTSEADLVAQLDELRRWHDATLGREGRVLELKREVNDLLSQTGKPARYPSAASPNPKEA